jgi:hypothetical protein
MGLGLMMFNTTFSNISGILWRSVLMLEKTFDLMQVADKLYHTTVVSSTARHHRDSRS